MYLSTLNLICPLTGFAWKVTWLLGCSVILCLTIAFDLLPPARSVQCSLRRLCRTCPLVPKYWLFLPPCLQFWHSISYTLLGTLQSSSGSARQGGSKTHPLLPLKLTGFKRPLVMSFPPSSTNLVAPPPSVPSLSFPNFSLIVLTILDSGAPGTFRVF